MKYNNIIFLGLCLGLTTYSALSADSVIKISGRVLDYGCTVSSDSLNATGENVSLGTVNKSKVPLGLSATYGQTGNKVAAGTVQSVIGVTFIYE